MGKRPSQDQTRNAVDAPQGMADLFRLHAGEIVAHIRKRVGEGPPDADDIAQQAFAQFAALGAKRRADIDNPRAFLFRTATNLIADYYRSAAVRTGVQMGHADPDIFMQEWDDHTPEIVLLSKERYQRVMDAVAALPRRRRRFFLLHRIKGWSYRKIARENGVGVGAVCRDVEAALAACRRALETLEEDET